MKLQVPEDETGEIYIDVYRDKFQKDLLEQVTIQY